MPELAAPTVALGSPPDQKLIDNPKPIAVRSGHTRIPKAQYSITARILGTERYRFNDLADLVPVDFALGWGRMTNPEVFQTLDIVQQNRYYIWHTDSSPVIPFREIIDSSANTHLIPANRQVSLALGALKPHAMWWCLKGIWWMCNTRVWE